MRRFTLSRFSRIEDLPAAPSYLMQGYTYFFPIAYSATDVAIYQQDVVIHRSVGVSYEETVGDFKVWHVYVGNRCKSDYGDVRFTDSTGAELAYYLWQDYDSSSARFTVRLEGADAAGVIQIHYGNPTATTTSDGDATYLFFDHFEGVAIDSGKWRVNSGGSASTSVDNSLFTLTSTSTTYWTHLTMVEYKPPTNSIIEARLRSTAQYSSFAAGVGVQGSSTGYIWAGESNLQFLFMDNKVSIDHQSKNAGTGGVEDLVYAGCPNNTWLIFHIQIQPESCSYRVYSDQKASLLGALNNNTDPPVGFGGNYYGFLGGRAGVMDFDYVLVRAYSATPPAATAFGPEQVTGTLPAAPSYLVPGARRFGLSRFTIPGTRQSRHAGVEGAGAALDAERGMLVAADRVAVIVGVGGYLGARSYAVPDVSGGVNITFEEVSGGVNITFEEVSGGVAVAFEEVYPI